MNRDRRLRRIRAMREVQLLSLAAEYEGLTTEDFDLIPTIDPAKDQWGNHELVMEDPSLSFEPKDLDDVISRSMNRDWITIPSEARRMGIPSLYYLDPARATEYEKYFGIYTDEYGYLHTPATQALHHAMVGGMAARGKAKMGNDYLVRWLKTPGDYATSTSKGKYLTLDPESERSVIAASSRLLEESHERPSLQRRMRVQPGGLVEQTTSHSRGIREIPYGTDISPDIARKIELLDRGMAKDLDNYPRLKQAVDSLNQSLGNRMDSLMREFRGTNRAMNFEEFTKEEMEDIVRQGILRIFLKAITEGDGAFAGTELGLPSEYRMK